MAFLVDTNILSETMKPSPDPAASRWMFETEQNKIYLSVVTMAEIRRGVDQMDHGRRRQRLEEWLTGELPGWFSGRILDVNLRVADQCGQLLAESKKKGWNLEAMDALIAATGLVHDLTVVTLNRRHFEKIGVRLQAL